MSAAAVVKFDGAYGTQTQDGLVITFPNVKPSEKQLHKCNNHRGICSEVSTWTGKHLGKDDDPVVYRSRQTIFSESKYGGDIERLFFNTVLTAYNPHHAICLRPEVMWQLIAHEVGTYIKQNADACAHFFTTKPDEQQGLWVQIEPGDGWEEIVLKFRPCFDEHITADVLNTFLPKFSTTDQEAEVATLLTFMDTVSPWYQYGAMYCCGFPKLLVAGNAADWKLLLASVSRLNDMFEGLRYYFADLMKVLCDIAASVETGEVEPEFWGSMFRYHSNSCPPILDGWLSAFIAFRRRPEGEHGTGEVATLRKPHEFNWRDQRHREDTLHFDESPKGLNCVNLKVAVPGQPPVDHVLIAGVLGSDYEEYLTPRLGFAVATA